MGCPDHRATQIHSFILTRTDTDGKAIGIGQPCELGVTVVVHPLALQRIATLGPILSILRSPKSKFINLELLACCLAICFGYNMTRSQRTKAGAHHSLHVLALWFCGAHAPVRCCRRHINGRWLPCGRRRLPCGRRRLPCGRRRLPCGWRPCRSLSLLTEAFVVNGAFAPVLTVAVELQRASLKVTIWRVVGHATLTVILCSGITQLEIDSCSRALAHCFDESAAASRRLQFI